MENNQKKLNYSAKKVLTVGGMQLGGFEANLALEKQTAVRFGLLFGGEKWEMNIVKITGYNEKLKLLFAKLIH